MYTHKIISKEFENGVLVLGVQFSNGDKVITEGVKPQDEAGFKYWLKQRLDSLNSLDKLGEVEVNTTVDLAEPADTRTPQEIAKALWLERDYLKEQVDKAIAKGYLTGTEPKVVQLNTWLKANFKPEYLGLI